MSERDQGVQQTPRPLSRQGIAYDQRNQITKAQEGRIAPPPQSSSDSSQQGNS